jgi:hypothetical protein
MNEENKGQEKFEGHIGCIKWAPDRPHVQNEDISKIHFGRIRYITQSKSRRDAFRKLIKEKGLKTNDLTLILSSIGFNPEFYHYTAPGPRHAYYLYQEDAMGELADHLYE